MPAQQGKVAIPTGLAAAHNEVKGREIKSGLSALPPGLRGVAEVLECHIGEYQSGDNKGKPFFSISAAIKQENHAKMLTMRCKEKYLSAPYRIFRHPPV